MTMVSMDNLDMILASLLLINYFFFFLKLIIINAYSHNFFMQSLPLYISYLFFMLLQEDILDIEKPDKICLFTFTVDEFSGSFLHPWIFSRSS